MDSTETDVRVLLLERMRDLEKNRLKDQAELRAIVRAFCAGGPRLVRAYQDELSQAETRLAKDPAVSLDDVYAQLIGLLKDPGPSEEGRQDEFRRILESFEGPKQ